MNLFTLHTGQASRIHRHREQEEIYLVLRGRLLLEIEGRERLIGPNQIVRVAPPGESREAFIRRVLLSEVAEPEPRSECP